MARRTRNPARSAARAAETALKAGEALGAAAAVIAARTERAAIAGANITAEDAAEMQLMVTEKVQAFGEAGAALADSASRIANRSMSYAATEAAAARAGFGRMAQCTNPMELAMVQARLVTDFWGRSLAHGMTVGALAARAGETALHPIHKTVTANHKRLKRK